MLIVSLEEALRDIATHPGFRVFEDAKNERFKADFDPDYPNLGSGIYDPRNITKRLQINVDRLARYKMKEVVFNMEKMKNPAPSPYFYPRVHHIDYYPKEGERGTFYVRGRLSSCLVR